MLNFLYPISGYRVFVGVRIFQIKVNKCAKFLSEFSAQCPQVSNNDIYN